MTIVARLIIDEWPLLIGDLLMSNKPNSDQMRNFAIPTTRNIPRTTNTGDIPCDLRQKIALLGDHIAVGWSGKQWAAEEVLTELNLRVTTEHLDMRAINKCFERQRSSVWENLELVGFVREPGLNVTAFSRSAQSATSPELGTVCLIGSGTNAMASHIANYSEIPTHETIQLNPANRAVLCGFTLAGRLLNDEIHTGANLVDLFGGGYELATISGGKFVKVDDVTYVYWQARYASDGEIYLTDTPKRVFRYAYKGDLLVLRAWEPTSPVTFSQTLYLIPPVYRVAAPEERVNLPEPDMNATWLCNYVVVHADGKRPWIATSITHRPDPTKLIHFFKHQGEFVFRVEPAFLQIMRKLITESPALRT